MAVVIPFAPHRRALPAEASATPRQEPATILFFTGVRYERQGEAAATTEAAVPRRSRALADTPTSRPKRQKKATGVRQPA